MKPSDFSLISDYLTLANIENREFTADIPGAVLSNAGLYTVNFNFSVKAQPQTITRAYMHHSKWHNANLWGVGRFGDTDWYEGTHYIIERMFLTTPNDSTVKLAVEIQGDPGTSISSHSIKIKVFRFKVPNIF